MCMSDDETIKMYSGADLLLAIDHTEPGGSIYLPEGIYHDGYCGAQQDGTENNCVLARSPNNTQFARKVSWHNGKKVKGEGAIQNWLAGEARTTGTWWITDLGNDDVANGTDDLAGDGLSDTLLSTWEGAHWAMRMGTSDGDAEVTLCVRDATDPDCQPRSATSQWSYGFSHWGDLSTIIEDATFSASQASSRLCIDNTISTTGTCSGDRRIQCTTNTGNRLTDSTGSCQFDFDGDGVFGETDEDLGTCEGFVDAIETDLAAGEDLYSWFKTNTQEVYSSDLTADLSTRGLYSLTSIESVEGSTCATTGKYVEFSRAEDAANDTLWPFAFLTFDISAQGNDNIWVTNSERAFNNGGEWTGMNLMPAHYIGSTVCGNGAGDVTGYSAGTNEIECDEIELVALGAGTGGRFHHNSIYNAGGDAGSWFFATIDGNSAALHTEVDHNYMKNGFGLGTDSSAWWWHDNVWEDWETDSGGIIAANFHHGGLMENEIFRRITGSHLMQCQGGYGGVYRDWIIEKSDFGVGGIRTNGCINATFDGFRWFGLTSGNVVAVDSETTADQAWGNKFLNFTVQGWAGANSKPLGAITFTDYNSSSWEGAIGTHIFENWRVQTISDNSAGGNTCLVFLDAGSGADGDAANGSGRSVDEDRKNLHLRNLDLETMGAAGTHHAICAGDDGTNIQEADDAGMLTWKGLTGEMPVWQNLSVDQVPIPDNPWKSISAAQAGDCGGFIDGIVVRVYDDTAVGACTDAGADGILDGGGSSSSVCVCDPAGDSADGAWAAF
jgi:hypothetical protein